MSHAKLKSKVRHPQKLQSYDQSQHRSQNQNQNLELNFTRLRDLIPASQIVVNPGKRLSFNSFDDFLAECSVEGKPFQLFEYQRVFIEALNSGKVVQVIKSRQLGLSLVSGLYAAYCCLKNEGSNANIISLTQNDSSNLGRRIKAALPNAVKAGENVLTVDFYNNSRLRFLPNTETAGRGVNNMIAAIVDECGFFDYSEILKSLAPASMWAQAPWIALISTPGAESSQFYLDFTHGLTRDYNDYVAETLDPAGKGYLVEETTDAIKLFIHFTAIPKFKAEPELYLSKLRLAGLTEEDINQEANLQWKTSSTINSPAFVSLFGTELPSELKQKGRRYIAIDPAGFGRDATAVVYALYHPSIGLGVDGLDMHQELDIEQIILKIKRNLKRARNPICVLEANGVGQGFITPCKKAFTSVITHHTTAKSKLQWYNLIYSLIKADKLYISNEVVSDQLESVPISFFSGSSRTKPRDRSGGHFDAVSALGILVASVHT